MYPPCNFCYHVFHIIPATSYLWSISLPGKNGTPNLNLYQDKKAKVANYTSKFTLVQLAHECVITNHYAIPLEISDTIRAAFKAKLWRMGKLFSKLGGTKCQEQLIKWKDGSEATWNFVVNEVEVQRQLLKRKRLIEVQIEKESTKRRKLENEVKVLQKTTTKKKTSKGDSKAKDWSFREQSGIILKVLAGVQQATAIQ